MYLPPGSGLRNPGGLVRAADDAMSDATRSLLKPADLFTKGLPAIALRLTRVLNRRPCLQLRTKPQVPITVFHPQAIDGVQIQAWKLGQLVEA